MDFFRRYLLDHLRSLAAVALSVCISAFFFYLYDFSFAAFSYIWAVLLAALSILFLVPSLISRYRKTKLLQKLKASLPLPPAMQGFSGTLPEEKLAEIIESLGEQLRKLEDQSAAKQQDMLEYYTLWVHQIKTPLSAMRLILQSDPGETNEALLQELFKVERYVEMVLGYLRLDDIGSDLRLEKCSVHEIVRQAVKKFAPLFIYQKLTLELQEFDNVVVTDEKWLCFVLEQLLSNALKYTKSGGISIFMEEPDVLVLRDTGTGISPEDLPRVFERGFTGFNGRQDKSASGLGLYLTKQVLNRLQTPIKITSTLGEGTQVRLFLHRDKLTLF